MYITLENASKAVSEYLSNEFSNMPASFMSAALAVVVEYKLQTSGTQVMKMLDDGTGRINIDVLENVINKYMSNVPDQTFKTIAGDIKIKSDTPTQLLEHLKRYGVN